MYCCCTRRNTVTMIFFTQEIELQTTCSQQPHTVAHGSNSPSEMVKAIQLPSQLWHFQADESQGVVRVCKIIASSRTTSQPAVISHCVEIKSNLTWSLFVHNHQVDSESCSALSSVPKCLDVTSLANLLCMLDKLPVCPGHPEKNFIDMVAEKKGQICGHSGSTVAFIDSYALVHLNGESYAQTVRTTSCEVLVHGGKCSSCKKYRPHLRALSSCWRAQKERKVSKFTNNQYLTATQQLDKMKQLQSRAQEAEKEVKRLQHIIERSVETNGTAVDPILHDDLVTIMEEESETIKQQYKKGTFKHLFWEQQLKAAKAKGPNGIRWHPMMIRWCLNLKMISSAAYHAMCSSGFVTLPSERTLRDYSNFFQSKAGFQHEVNKQLMKEAKLDECDDLQRHVVLVFDEMKIKEDLVYNKNSGEVIGFVNMGNVSDQLSELEEACKAEKPEHPKVAKQMLVFMVRGIFKHLEFPYAHFPTTDITSDCIMTLAWEAIRHLEFCGFKVIAVTCDGASTNRKFIRAHPSLDKDNKLSYKAKNPYSKEPRWVYFVSDVPHLMKTTRNCWSHSFAHGRKRKLWVS